MCDLPTEIAESHFKAAGERWRTFQTMFQFSWNWSKVIILLIPEVLSICLELKKKNEYISQLASYLGPIKWILYLNVLRIFHFGWKTQQVWTTSHISDFSGLSTKMFKYLLYWKVCLNTARVCGFIKERKHDDHICEAKTANWSFSVPYSFNLQQPTHIWVVAAVCRGRIHF